MDSDASFYILFSHRFFRIFMNLPAVSQVSPRTPSLPLGFPQATEKFRASRAPELDGADAYSSEYLGFFWWISDGFWMDFGRILDDFSTNS